MEVRPSRNNTAKKSVGEDLVKIRASVAEQSRQKKKKTRKKRMQNASWNVRRYLRLAARRRSLINAIIYYINLHYLLHAFGRWLISTRGVEAR